MIILSVETSCDETAVALVRDGREVLTDQIFSQADLHAVYGGVVPEIASRSHAEVISYLAQRALDTTGVSRRDIGAVAVTYAPGLIGALLVGVNFAKAAALALNVPLVPVHHIRGHIAANYLAFPELEPPFLCLAISGGNTMLVDVRGYTDMRVLGATRDDAAGECFDKTARVLGLPYPGGPNVEKLAREGANAVKLPKMLKGAGGYDFSYSGLKTAVVNYVHAAEQSKKPWSKADVAHSFQCAALDVLAEKLFAAAEERKIGVVAAGGGVSANGYLRERLAKEAAGRKMKLVLPEKRYCTDNACMIAAEGYIRYAQGEFASLDLNAEAYIPLKNASEPL